jgi:hypothetical protein
MGEEEVRSFGVSPHPSKIDISSCFFTSVFCALLRFSRITGSRRGNGRSFARWRCWTGKFSTGTRWEDVRVVEGMTERVHSHMRAVRSLTDASDGCYKAEKVARLFEFLLASLLHFPPCFPALLRLLAAVRRALLTRYAQCSISAFGTASSPYFLQIARHRNFSLSDHHQCLHPHQHKIQQSQHRYGRL